MPSIKWRLKQGYHFIHKVTSPPEIVCRRLRSDGQTASQMKMNLGVFYTSYEFVFLTMADNKSASSKFTLCGRSQMAKPRRWTCLWNAKKISTKWGLLLIGFHDVVVCRLPKLLHVWYRKSCGFFVEYKRRPNRSMRIKADGELRVYKWYIGPSRQGRF